MNFLAHCALAQDAVEQWGCNARERGGLLAGAIIGDFVKGTIPTDWPIELQAGARLHRRIDAQSNLNDHIRNSCNRYPDHLRRFAPIFVDMLADHCLSHAWDEYYRWSRPGFARDCYAAVQGYQQHLNTPGQRFFGYMYDEDLLANYHDWHHISRGLAAVLRRLKRSELHAEVDAASRDLVTPAQADFAVFYPQLREHLHSWNAFDALARTLPNS